jgi:uncharacterized protein (DUF2237 family)
MGDVIHLRAKNVFGQELMLCSQDPLTGFTRDGFCHLSAVDYGQHGVCALMDDEFLEFSKQRGNDLITPMPDWGFPGLKAGDYWCLCMNRWLEAYEQGKAPKLKLAACHKRLLKFVPIEVLKTFAA